MSTSVDNNHVLDLTIGAGLVGFTVAALLYGITSGQALLYYIRYGYGPGTWRTQCFVAVTWFLDTVHMVILSYGVYHLVIVIHGNPAGLAHVIWAYGTVLIITECNTFLVRVGYAHRIWKYNNRKALMPLIIAIPALALFALSIFCAQVEIRLQSFDELLNIQWIFYLAFGLQIMIDFPIAVCMISVCYRLHTGLKRLDEVMHSVTVFIINTGILSLVLLTLTLIFFIILPMSYIFLALYWVLAKLHVCSFLAVLNAEKDLVARTSAHSMHDSPMFTTALRVDDDFPTGLPRTTRPESVPLSGSDLAQASIPHAVAPFRHSSASGSEPKAESIAFAV